MYFVSESPGYLQCNHENEVQFTDEMTEMIDAKVTTKRSVSVYVIKNCDNVFVCATLVHRHTLGGYKLDSAYEPETHAHSIFFCLHINNAKYSVCQSKHGNGFFHITKFESVTPVTSYTAAHQWM